MEVLIPVYYAVKGVGAFELSTGVISSITMIRQQNIYLAKQKEKQVECILAEACKYISDDRKSIARLRCASMATQKVSFSHSRPCVVL